MTEHSIEDVQAAQHRLQGIVALLAQDRQGDTPDTIQQDLTRLIQEAGLPEQPEKWTHDTSIEIAAGRLTVMNPQEIPEVQATDEDSPGTEGGKAGDTSG